MFSIFKSPFSFRFFLLVTQFLLYEGLFNLFMGILFNVSYRSKVSEPFILITFDLRPRFRLFHSNFFAFSYRILLYETSTFHRSVFRKIQNRIQITSFCHWSSIAPPLFVFVWFWLLYRFPPTRIDSISFSKDFQIVLVLWFKSLLNNFEDGSLQRSQFWNVRFAKMCDFRMEQWSWFLSLFRMGLSVKMVFLFVSFVMNVMIHI